MIQSFIIQYNGVVINNYYRFKNDRVWPKMLHGTVRKGHKVGIIQAVTVQYMYISSSLSFQGE